MTSELYIASKSAVGLDDQVQLQHLYIVYDPNGTINSGDELVIRSGPPGGTTGLGGYTTIGIAIDLVSATSLDGASTVLGLPSVTDRNFTLLASGTNADVYWQLMKDFAISLSNDSNAAVG